MKIYISIPITGHNEAKMREHADHVKMALSRNGHEAISPFDLYIGRNPGYEDYICRDLRAMLDCDALFLCKGWRDSCGCNIEHDVALRYREFGKKNFKLMYEQ